MKKRTKIILIILTVLIGCGIYVSYNFSEDKAKVGEILTIASNEKLQEALKAMTALEEVTNPLINHKYQQIRGEYFARFIDNTETIEDNFGNETVYGIANIYRNYWRVELLKANKERTDTSLYAHLTEYILENNLTTLPKDSLGYLLKSDKEMTRIIENEGFQCKFFWLNGIQDLLIWKDERRVPTTVELPNGAFDITVVHLDNVLLTGYAGYASFDVRTTGGWAEKEKPIVYCLSIGYDVTSENYLFSFLKHETTHFADLNNYPKLRSADLEYRAKLIELMYCTQASIYSRIAEFLNGASAASETYSHPYADYCIIQDFSQIIFQNNYEDDYEKWLQVDVKTINETATQLFEANEAALAIDPHLSKVIEAEME